MTGDTSDLRVPTSAHPLATPADEFLAVVRSGVPVSAISTPRAALHLGREDAWEAVAEDSALADFDQIPLTDAAGETITAVFMRDEGPHPLRPLREDMFMSAEAPLLAFLETADRQRFRLLVDGGRVTGLVTISDLQRLPVYSVLFSLVVAVEMLLMDWIRRASVDDEDWLQHLKSGDRRQIERYWERRRAENLHVDRLAVASFTHELTAADGLGLFRDDASRRGALERLIGLRDQVYHGIDIAPTAAHALELPDHARNALSLVAWLHAQINDLPA